MIKKAIMFAGVLALSSTLLAETKVIPTGNISIMGGQYWVTGADPSSPAGNVDIFFSPVINFSPNTALLPIYAGTYSGTKDVRELVGGGTLTRELQDHSLSLKFIEKFDGGWKLKLRAGYKIEYLKETKDETWGKGLFDYEKIIGGFEFEKPGRRWVSRIGGDCYTMHYPNYQSLISQPEFESSIDTTTYTEISSQAGTDVLDFTALAGFYNLSYAFAGNVQGTLQYDFIRKYFKDEKIVTQTGEFSNTLRQDTGHYLTLGINLSSPRVIAGLSNVIQYYESNQNSFDMANSKYIDNYYGFVENNFMPNITFLLGRGEVRSALYLFWEVAWRNYLDRPAQYADASYKNVNVAQTTSTTGCMFTYPLSRSLSLKFSTMYRDADSNMRYEKNYMYNYYSFNYFAGINMEL